MRDEALLLGIPKILTAPRLARAIGTPLAISLAAAAAVAAALLLANRGIAVAALAWSAGALLLMRPDERRLHEALRDATGELRRFLARRDDVRTSPLPARFLSMVNPLEDEHGWPSLVLLGGLPRGGWSLLAVPPLLAAASLFTAGALLVLGLPPLVVGLLLLLLATTALLLGLDAYASMLRGTLIPLAPRAGRSLRDLLVLLAAIDSFTPSADPDTSGLTTATRGRNQGHREG